MSECVQCTFTLTENPYCQGTNATQVGENNDVILIPPYIFDTFIRQNLLLPVTSPGAATVLNCLASTVKIPRYSYDQPVVTSPGTVADALFPDGANTSGLFLAGGPKMFNPTIGTATDANGISYQTSKLIIPVSAQLYSPDFIAYVMNNRWNALRMTADRRTLLVYGGLSGFLPNADDVVTLMYSGNDENSGAGLLPIEQKKASWAVTYLQVGDLSTTPSNAIEILYSAFKLKCTMPQVSQA